MKSIAGVGWVGLVAFALACGGTSSNQPEPENEGGEGGRKTVNGAGTGDGPAIGASDAGGNPDVSAGGSSAPAGPPAQGAMIMTVTPQNPAPVGRACPTMAFTTDIPQAPLPERLSENNYRHHVIDGEGGASVTCRVTGSGRYVVEGKIQMGGRALIIEDGFLSGETGTAMVTIMDSSQLSPASLSSSAPCTLDAQAGNLQIQNGAIWASFYCASVASPPSSECRAEGFFVLENCEQE